MAEDVAALAGDGVPGVVQAEGAGAEGQEGVAGEAGGGRGPGVAGEGALVGGEDGAGGVSLAWDV